MNYLKKNYGITNESELQYKLSRMTEDRNVLYGSIGKEQEIEEKKQEQSKHQHRRKENER